MEMLLQWLSVILKRMILDVQVYLTIDMPRLFLDLLLVSHTYVQLLMSHKFLVLFTTNGLVVLIL
jgi:hypothetical protein